ncbi:MAG: hypothetical protein P0120_07810 [Nitrospira sp.]|nr:hypothetical protein [Nitrospira sp.]
MAENRELALVLRLVADEFQKELRNSQGALSSFNSFIKDWRTQLTAAGTALFAIAKSAANYGDELAKMGQRLGTTVEETARLQHAARLSDTDLQGLSSTVAFLSKNMLEASRGNQDAQQAFAQLGVTVTTTSGDLKGTTDILLELSDRFRLMPEGPEKLALAMAVMGKSAKEVLPLLNSNMREAFQETKELGLEMSERAAKAAEQFNDQLTKLQGAVQGVGNSIGEVLIPHVTSLSKILTTVTADAGSALRALLNLDKLEAPQVGVAQPDGGGRRLRIMPAPPADIAKQFQTQPFFKTPEQAAAEQERLAKEHERLEKELARRGQEQEKLGKAKLDIFLAQNRALEIQNKLMGGQGELSQYFLAFDRQEQFRKEDEAAEERKGRMIVDRTQMEVRLTEEVAAAEERKGRMIVEETQRQVRARDEAMRKERDVLVQSAQAWIDYDNQVGVSTELRYDHQIELLEAMLAKETQLTQEESARLLMAWQNHDSQLAEDILNRSQIFGQQRETLEIQTLTRLAAINQQYSNDIFRGWAMGMQKYVQDTQSAFGIAADLARRTAQFMEQSFRQFFFDLFEGKIKSLKDLFKSFADFAKQVIAHVAAQLATMAVLNTLASASGGGGLFGGFMGGGGGGFSTGLTQLFGGIGGRNVSGIDVRAMTFASGGPVLGAGNQDTVRALLTPGEGVLNRSGMAALDRLNAGSVPASNAELNVTVNFFGGTVDERPKVNVRREFNNLVIDCILKNRDDLSYIFKNNGFR